MFLSRCLGLALYKLMEYLTKKNRRKIMVGHGLKQIGEHMNVVTRTMSADPSGMYQEYFTAYNNGIFKNIFILFNGK